MSRSKNSVELCALLVDETYGELTSRIFTVLLRHGRLETKGIRLHTKLSQRAVLHGLTVLIQQGLVYHNRDDDQHTFYEANDDAAYGLARSGKILEIVESRYGPFGRDVMQKLFTMGYTKISDLANAYESTTVQEHHPNGNGKMNGHATKNGVNGLSEEHPSTGPLHTVLAHFLEAGIIEPVVESMLRSPTDLYNMAEKEITNQFFSGGTKGIKQKEELKQKIQSRIEAARSDGPQWQPRGMKRKMNGDHNGTSGGLKRRRLSSGEDATKGDLLYEDDGTRLDLNLVVRINYEKCTVAIRSQALVALAYDRIGETTSLIYAEALRILESQIPRCRLSSKVHVDEVSAGPSFTTMQLTTALSKSINPDLGIGKAESSKDGKVAKGVNGDVHMKDSNGNGKAADEDEDDPFADEPRMTKRLKVTFQDKLPGLDTPERSENRMQQIKNHLQLLESDDFHLLRKCGNSGQGEWTVDFARINQLMRQAEIDNLLLENHGVFGHRLARILNKFGKLDEKQLPNLALMKQKDVRTKLAEMQLAGMVDIQEIPKDANRSNPNRVFYFWFFDSERVASVILENTYKMMSRCLQRLDIERRSAASVIEVTDRSDLQDQQPEDYLEPGQLNTYEIFLGKEEALLNQVFRLDQLIGIFRDF
ncbi:uncharacterized protein L3040_004596 [Drepanopeziza brunnea f. sp. 'multigermtubi']|uniref:uncharacterized protein n=1 Tax=Drepanopeziza brunnea f. sp. 'multigermtubi' TaxID=698441 RepID=UPI002394DADD|nr:hypothetical protein L3040_004596 [Drepanopeziza brunnea f. sp. 'multigermtubi']